MYKQPASFSLKPKDLRRVSGRPVTSWKWLWVAAVLLPAVVYVLVYQIPDLSFTAVQSTYLVQPACWLLLAMLAGVAWQIGIQSKPVLDSNLVMLALLAGGFQVAVYLLAGIFSGFGHSPYTHKLLPLLGNLFFAASQLVALELCRACLVRVLAHRHPTQAVVAATLLFTVLSLPMTLISSIHDVPALFNVLGNSVFPGVMENMLASVLALIGGPIPALAYRGMLHGFEWLSPILPRFDWSVAAFLGTTAPGISLWIVNQQFLAQPTLPPSLLTPQQHQKTAPRHDAVTSALWVLVGVVAVSLVWFNNGLFGIQPALVSGPSMNPTLYVGDVVIVQQVPPEKVQVGDIIHYRSEQSYIAHRVREKQFVGEDVWFITQGDNTNVVDPPVSPPQYDGRVILVVPKVGWVSIWVRRLIGWA